MRRVQKLLMVQGRSTKRHERGQRRAMAVTRTGSSGRRRYRAQPGEKPGGLRRAGGRGRGGVGWQKARKRWLCRLGGRGLRPRWPWCAGWMGGGKGESSHESSARGRRRGGRRRRSGCMRSRKNRKLISRRALDGSKCGGTTKTRRLAEDRTQGAGGSAVGPGRRTGRHRHDFNGMGRAGEAHADRRRVGRRARRAQQRSMLRYATPAGGSGIPPAPARAQQPDAQAQPRARPSFARMLFRSCSLSVAKAWGGSWSKCSRGRPDSRS